MSEVIDVDVYARVNATGYVELRYENGGTMFGFQKFTKLDRILHVRDGDKFTISIEKVE